MVFFKILIRKILSKLTINKLLLIGFIFGVLCLIFGSPVKAATIDYTYGGVEYSVNGYDEGNGYVIICNSDGSPYRNYFVGRNGTRYNPWRYVPGANNRNGTFNQIGNSNFYCTFTKNSSGVYNYTYAGYHTGNLSIPSGGFVLYSSMPVYSSYTDVSNNVLYLAANTLNYNVVADPIVSPFITDTTTIANWSFDNLVINSGSITPYYSVIEDNIEYQYFRTFKLETTYEGVVYTTDLRQYATAYDNDYVIFTIPKNELTNHFNVYNGNTIQFDLYVQPDDAPNSTGNWSSYSLGSYTFTLTDEEQQQINDDSTKQVIGAIDSGINNLNNSITNLDNTQQETNNKIDELNNNLTSTDVDTDEAEGIFANFGEGMIITDNTHLEQLFTMLYNAFCNNEVVGVHFTLPFVNKEVTIDSTTISSFYPQQVVTIANLFVWGMIGLYIIKDIRTMLNKTAEGNIENISSDVKKEVL